jgi:hypothetical protein
MALWKAISAVVAAFAANKNLARKPTLVLMDGDVIKSLLSENLGIDALLLETPGDALDSKLVAPILLFAFHSSGCCFYPRSAEEALRVIQTKEFVDMNPQKVEHRSDKKGRVCKRPEVADVLPEGPG